MTTKKRISKNESIKQIVELLRQGYATEEILEAEKKKFYVGNGRVFWGDGVIPKNEINTTNIIEDIESESTEMPF